MKILRLACLIPVWISASALAESPVPLPQTRVSLTYAEFRQLFDAAQKPPTPPESGPATAFVSAAYEIDWTENNALVQAIWQVENFTSSRRTIPVAPTGLGIAATENNQGVFLLEDNHLAVLVRTTGAQEARVHFASGVTEDGEGRWKIRFPVLPAATNVLKLRNVPPALRVVVQGTQELPAPAGERHFALSARTTEVALSLEEARPRRASRWEWRSEVVVTPGDTGLQFRARLMAALLDGDGGDLQIPLPKDIRGLRPVADGLASWRVEPDPDGNPVLNLRWNENRQRERLVELHYDLPVAMGTDTWPLSAPAPTLPGAANVFVIPHSAAVELSGDGLMTRTDAPPLSEWVREHIGNRDVSFLRGGETGQVRVVWLPLAEPANLIIRSAKYQTRIVPDGSVLTEVEVHLESESSARWEFQLPTSARLLRASLDDRPVRPIRRGEALEIPLESSSRGGKSTVTLSYTDTLSPLDPVGGGLTMTLPATKTFIHALQWALQIPDSYEVAGIESNAQVLPSEQKGRLELAQELIHDKTVAAEIFYRKRGLAQ